MNYFQKSFSLFTVIRNGIEKVSQVNETKLTIVWKYDNQGARI